MRFAVPLPPSVPLQTALNRCGYATNRDPNVREMNFVRRLGSYFYPRFHLYLGPVGNGRAELNLHLDMKQPSYGQGHAHSGEYDGEQVEAEAARIAAIFASLGRGV